MTYALKPSEKALVDAYDNFLQRKKKLAEIGEHFDWLTAAIAAEYGAGWGRSQVDATYPGIYINVWLQPGESLERVLPFLEMIESDGGRVVEDSKDAQNATRDLLVEFPNGVKVKAVFWLEGTGICQRVVVGYREVEPQPIYEMRCPEASDQEAA